MRLRLTVQRHSLPPAHVLWTVGVPRQPDSAAGASITVSQFLEQVNDVIPLESEEWGLEDYAVEVGGFECLHFSELTQILKEDDEVCIRPLQTSDLRFRRVSGRHQITADGRHLIDGVAFGRPFLRRTERPAVKIPPRKRRRVLYDAPEDDTNEDIYNDRQVVVHPGFKDSGITAAEAEDDEADEDDVSLGQEEEDLSAELEEIHRDLRPASGGVEVEVIATAPTAASSKTTRRRSTRSQALKQGLGLQGPEILKLRDENGRPYPAGYNNPLLELYSQEASAQTEVNARKRKRHSNTQPVNTRQKVNKQAQGHQDPAATPPINRRESSSSSKSVRFEDNALTTPPTTILDAEDSEDTEDEDFQPPDVTHDETDESDKENAEPKVNEDVSSEIMSSDSKSSSSSSESKSESEDESDETSSSGSSSTGSSEAEPEAEQPSTSTSKTTDTAIRSSSEGSSQSSSSTSADEEPLQKATTKSSKSVRSTTSAKPVSQTGKDKSQIPTLPRGLYNKIRKLEEPERVRRWLKSVLEEDSKGQVVETSLYDAYRTQFRDEGTGRINLLPAHELIKYVHDIFKSSRTAFLAIPRKKYVVKGIRPREHVSNPIPVIVPPGKGKFSTQKRNQRRRAARKFKNLQASDKADESVIKNALIDSVAEAGQPEKSGEPKGQGPTSVEPDSLSSNFEFTARRQALLDSIASGGVEVSTESLVDKASTQIPDNHPVGAGNSLVASELDAHTIGGATPLSPKAPVHDVMADKAGYSQIAGDTSAVPSGPVPSQQVSEAVETFQSQALNNEDPTERSKPRSKIDLASSRRLLFGALGLKTPKTKEDEKALQTKLMQDVRPIKQLQTGREIPQDCTEVAAGDDESWRTRIDLRAVECCYEGIELSTPPFPFVQRWDPQQKRGYSNIDTGRKSGKGKKRKRNNDRYYDDGIEEQASMPTPKPGTSASPTTDFEMVETQPAEPRAEQRSDVQLTSSDLNQGAVNEQLLRESQQAAEKAQIHDDSPKDLPALPGDMATCPCLTLESAKPGTVIAFKKLDMSAETNWQPRVSDYRTAIVDECRDDGTLYMTLAFRDRPNQETSYDPETGERLYHKFEMPGFDNEDDEGSEGHLELPLAELIEPKIVGSPESKHFPASASHIDGASDDHAIGHATGTDNEPEPQDNTGMRDFDETWEGFEESGMIGQLKDADVPEAFEQSEKRKQGESVRHNKIRQSEVVEQAQETEMEIIQENESELRLNALPPEGDTSREVNYPDLEVTIKELGGSPLDEASAAALDANAIVPALQETVNTSQSKATTVDSRNQLRQDRAELTKDAGCTPRSYQEDTEVNVQKSNPPSPRFHGFDANHSAENVENGSETLPAEIPETNQGPSEVADSVPIPSLDRLEPPNYHVAEDQYMNDGVSPANDEEVGLSYDAQTSGQVTLKHLSSSISTSLSRGSEKKLRLQKGASQTRSSISPPRINKAKLTSRHGGSQKRSSASPPKASNPRTKARNSGPEPKPNVKNNDDKLNLSNSDSDLPTLEKVFASRISSLQTPSSQSSTNLTIKPEDNSSQIANLHALPVHNNLSQTSKSNKSSTSITSPLPILSSDDENNPSSSFIFSTQMPQGSQIVDLTMSSDPVEEEPGDSAYDGDSSLPTGPGWIRKLRTSQRAKSVGRGDGRRSNGRVD